MPEAQGRFHYYRMFYMHCARVARRLTSCKGTLKIAWLRAEMLFYATWLGFRNGAKIQRLHFHPLSLALPGSPRKYYFKPFYFKQAFQIPCKNSSLSGEFLITQLWPCTLMPTWSIKNTGQCSCKNSLKKTGLYTKKVNVKGGQWHRLIDLCKSTQATIII